MLLSNAWSDKKLIQLITSGGALKEKAANYLMDNVTKGAVTGESKLSSYFYKILFNKSVDLFRKNTTNKIDYPEVLPDTSDKERRWNLQVLFFLKQPIND